ncbi:KR domain-containing protein [Chaetomium sp. MPI-SDFR-AT-0129]|nr:KR domain-containing protein [Chaetomium sp. MPI-SDFR-AT-0129]
MPSATRSPSTSSDSAFVSDENLPRVTLSSPPSSVSSSVNLAQNEDPSDTSGYAATSFPGYAEKSLEEQLEPIAVVGMGCRLPGDVKSASDFWDLMMSKGTGNTPKVPSSRFNIDAHIHANNDRPGSFGVLGGYFLQDDLADFDPGLFGITPIEAMWMDPQQRKLLEVVYEALESGGIPVEKLAGTRTAVFAASFTADWQQMSFKDASFRHSLAATGVDPGIISNRISHVFNLRGPSIVCNTACSSSVYALHNACNALRNGEAEGAIVGGVNLIITVDQHMNTAKLGVLSPTSTCHTFDASADGYGRADAVGAVYLKRLSDAVRDGDPIRGVIRSSATNSNGKVPGYGITYPNREGQYEVITAAYERGGDLDPRLTGYFECHGTGTAVGDPIEVDAVSRAMNKQRRPGIDPPLWIGAVKTNIGHSEAASGISALIKAILIAERGVIPATRGVVKLNPQIEWEDWQVRAVTDDPVPFPSELPVRRVSVNSFGYGGTNAHMIIEGTASIAPGSEAGYRYVDRWATNRLRKPGFFRRAVDRKRPYLLPFSAHDKATLRRNIDALGPVASEYNLVDLSHTLANRRSILASKAYAVANHETLDTLFSSVGESFVFADNNATKSPARELAFVFTGQGAQWARMGAHLMEYSPHFLQTIRDLDLVLEHVEDGPEWSIEDLLNEHADTSPVQDAEFSQPLCTAVQIAVVRLLESWGVRPVATVGHSSGEMAAAYAAGLVSAEDAMIAAYYRGIVAKEVNTGGAMLAVGLGAEGVQPWIDECGVEDKVVVACHNSPALVTLSGDADALILVQGKLEAASVFNRAVKTGGKAYHSHHMVPAAERFKALVREAKRDRLESDRKRRSVTYHGLGELLTTKAQMVSSVTNSVIPAGTLLDEEYWSRNLVSPVLFNQAVQTLLSDPTFSQVDVLVEVGPHAALAGPIKQIKEALNSSPVGNAKSKAGVGYVPTLIRGEDSGARLLKVAGELFLRGYQQLEMECVTSAYHVQSLKSLKFKTKSKRLSRGNSTGNVKLRVSPGATIVDLPPYQWNYTRPFWAENRASREQRLPRFPRHDVLGQRVIGGSLAEPTWNNVLRLRDLPWLKHHSLGGEAVFPAAGYFAMAIEAVTQLHELDESDDSPKAIDSYVLRDIDIKKALVTPDTEDGIEVLTSLRPSVFGAPFWDFSVSSVDIDENKTTTWKEHMTGSVAINAASTPRGSQKKPKPRTPPDDLTQRASGKTWNQALRAVGFDYGPTFQDMDNVRFDGKRYVATCTTNVKREVDPTLGESRYPLHPAVVDSTLQLSIAAIYAGRTSAMDCGVVPVQVDQVTIWPPTDEQVTHKSANCYAWVDHRGTRTFENSVQMTSTAGTAGEGEGESEGELIMEIVNVRTTRYEAAIPQKAEDHVPLEPAPYGEMVWQPDIDRLIHTSGHTSGHTLSKIKSPSELVSLSLFKYPGLKVLDAASDLAAAKELLSSYPSAAYTLAVDGDSLSEPFSETEVKAELESGSGPQQRLANTAVATIQDLTATTSASNESESPSASYDMLVAPAHLVLALEGHVKPGGYVASFSQDDGSIALSRKAAPPSNESAQATESASPGDDTTTTFTNLDIALVFRNSPDSSIINRTKLAIEAALSSGSDSHQPTVRVRVHVRSLQSYHDEDAHQVDGPVASHVVMLADLEAASVTSPLLSSLTETEFSAIQRITDSSSSLLWVTNGGLLEGKRPEHAMASGLARVVRSEQASLDFRTLDVDTDESDDVYATTSAIADNVARVVRCQVAAKASKGTPADEELDEEREMCLFKGETYISRLVRNRELNNVFADSDSAPDKPVLGSFVPGRDRLSGRIRQGKVVFEHVYQDETGADSSAELEPGTVQVAVERSGLTREGVLAITGADYPTTFSHELGGVVVRTGPGVTHLVPGDNVVGFHIDRFSTVQHVPAAMLHKLGPDQDMTTVVSLLMASATALYGLDVLARLQAGETILVLHQTGFVGVAVAMIARARGATVYIEAQTQEEVEFLQDRVGLAPGQILSDLSGSNSGQQSRLSDHIAALTGGRGADVVFSVGGAVKPSTAHEAWRCIAPFGRFLDASPGRKNAGVQRQAALDAIPVRRSAQYLPYDVLDLLETRPSTMAALLPSILEHVSIGALGALGKPVVPITLSDLAAAVSTFSDAFGSAKPVLALDAPCEDAPIITAPPRDSPRFKFNPDVTYLLVGCLGGLGRSLTRWMMASGARRFLFLSRSGTDAPSAAKLVDDLGAAGATVQVVRGDVANRSDVLRAVEQAPPTSPHPIRGVIHAAMVLRDAVFHSMPYSSWTSSLAPKVQGAMNLHSVLVEELDLPLDFFLMTSSVSGILGTPGQANYAAANSYLDALARHMNRQRGTNTGISCILPMVLGVGVVAENDEIEDALRRKGMYGIDEDHLLQSFEAGLSLSSLTNKSVDHDHDHIVIGLDPMLLRRAAAEAASEDEESDASFWVDDTRFRHVVHAMRGSDSAAASGGGDVSILAAAASSSSPAEAVALIERHFVRKLATMLMMDEESFDVAVGSIASYGIDSMIGAELRNWIFREYRIDMPFQQLLAPSLTIAKFAGQVCASVGVGVEVEA